MNRFLLYTTLICIFFLGACAKSSEITNSSDATYLPQTENSEIHINEFNADYEHDAYFDDYEDEVVRKDPLIGWNKTWFAFNDFVLLKVLKPTYKVYSKTVPKTFRNGITNFRYNLKAPMRMGNALLQGEFAQFFIELGRLMINVMTSAGLADVASQNQPLFPHTPENLRFGYTLAKWNVPQGPYLILPFFGPSTPREGIGTIVDMGANPLSYTIPWEASLAISSLTTVNDFDNLIDTYEFLKGNAIDPYIALRNAYLERLSHNEPD